MKQMTWMEMREIANAELLRYRRNCVRLRQIDPDTGLPACAHRSLDHPLMTEAEIAEARLWKRAIERVRDAVRQEDPVMARFMVRYFAMRVPKNRRQSERARHMQLADELHVADSTLYKWKESILQRVIAAAIQSGALRPYDMD